MHGGILGNYQERRPVAPVSKEIMKRLFAASCANLKSEIPIIGKAPRGDKEIAWLLTFHLIFPLVNLIWTHIESLTVNIVGQAL